jgi:hypothetical protein
MSKNCPSFTVIQLFLLFIPQNPSHMNGGTMGRDNGFTEYILRINACLAGELMQIQL